MRSFESALSGIIKFGPWAGAWDVLGIETCLTEGLDTSSIPELVLRGQYVFDYIIDIEHEAFVGGCTRVDIQKIGHRGEVFVIGVQIQIFIFLGNEEHNLSLCLVLTVF